MSYFKQSPIHWFELFESVNILQCNRIRHKAGATKESCTPLALVQPTPTTTLRPHNPTDTWYQRSKWQGCAAAVTLYGGAVTGVQSEQNGNNGCVGHHAYQD